MIVAVKCEYYVRMEIVKRIRSTAEGKNKAREDRYNNK